MTEQDKLTYLKLAFQCVGLGFTDEQVELISRTSDTIKKKKGNFNLRDAAIIRAEVLRKHRPVIEPEFEELEENLPKMRMTIIGLQFVTFSQSEFLKVSLTMN